MIVRNEGHQLANCLGPVAQLFDEIVIVDTGSTDNTCEVAREFTPKFLSFPWCDDFSAARNESLRHATGEWIFWLDADDRISPDNVAKLADCLSHLNGQPQAYLMNTACSSRYACEGANLITHTRLFRRHPDLRWQGRVHEQLRPELNTLGYKAIWSDVQIDHTGYQDQGLQHRKLQRDLRLLRMDYATNPDDASTLLHLGLTYYHLGRFGPARTYLERLLSRSTEPSDHLRQVYGVLASMLMREGKIQEAVQTFDRALLIFPDADDLLYSKAECLYELDRYGEARETLTQIIVGSSKFQYRGGVPGDIRDQRAPRKLADICRLERDFALAESLLMSLLARFPHDTHSWHTLGRVFLDSRQRLKLLAVLEHLRACPQGDVFATMLMAMWHLNAREFDAAGQTIEQLIGLAPLMPMPRILRVEWLNQVAAPVTARIQACRDLLRLQPSNHEARQLLTSLELLAQENAQNSVPKNLAAVTGQGAATSVAIGG
jgi:glycosyltransferase involved in cell wall biosynthesis